MGKKILGILFFVGALLLLVGSVASGSLFSDQGSVATTYGNFLGILVPIILYILSGIFLLTYDNPTKINYIDGFKKRSKQNSKIIVFIVFYAILILITSIGVGASYTDNYFLSFIVAIIPYMIPFMIFCVLLLVCVLPHNASKKYFINNDETLNEYLSASEVFQSYSSDNFVIASGKALYFPKLFCVIPFNQISYIKLTKELWLQYTYFYLQNGKNFYITTKHYDRICEAINVNKQSQQ